MPTLCDRVRFGLAAPLISGLAFSANGLVAAVSKSSEGILWTFDPEMERPALRQSGVIPHLRDLSGNWHKRAWLSPNGRVLVTDDAERTVVVWRVIRITESAWDVEPCAQVRTPTGDVCCVAFSQDSTRLLVGGDTGANVWNLASTALRDLNFRGDITLVSKELYLDVDAACFSIDNSHVLLGYSLHAVRLWQLDHESGPTLTGHNLDHPAVEKGLVGNNNVPSVALANDARFSASACSNGTVLWQAIDPIEHRSQLLRRDEGQVGSLGLGFLANGRSGWTHWHEGTVELWRIEEDPALEECNVVTKARLNVGPGELAGISPDGRWMIWWSHYHLSLWRLK
jgi:WD40 repeat protein